MTIIPAYRWIKENGGPLPGTQDLNLDLTLCH